MSATTKGQGVNPFVKNNLVSILSLPVSPAARISAAALSPRLRSTRLSRSSDVCVSAKSGTYPAFLLSSAAQDLLLHALTVVLARDGSKKLPVFAHTKCL